MVLWEVLWPLFVMILPSFSSLFKLCPMLKLSERYPKDEGNRQVPGLKKKCRSEVQSGKHLQRMRWKLWKATGRMGRGQKEKVPALGPGKGSLGEEQQ